MEVAGLYPDLYLSDKRESTQVWTVAALLGLGLAAIAFAAIMGGR